MSRLSTTQKKAIQQALVVVLSQTRPEEVFLVEDAFEKPNRLSRNSEALGFGTGLEVLIWLHPMVEVLKEFGTGITEGMGKYWGEELTKWIFDKNPHPALLDPGSLEKLRHHFVERLIRTGVPTPASNAAGDSLIALIAKNPKLIRDIAGVK